MNSRDNILLHPSGLKIQTPLLIPSFSSKGFALNNNEKSEICDIMHFSSEFIYESQLLSAYDLFHKHLIPITEISGKTELMFLDSGGYETSNSYDLSETRKYLREKKEWDKDSLENFLVTWDYKNPTVLVNYDNINNKKPIENQISEAIEFFNNKTQAMKDFLLKPDNCDTNVINLNKIIENINDLIIFDFLGITEKELGLSLFERMKNIYLIRKELDKLKFKLPIHIFGALDPFSVIMYFLAGAEVFDGLSWLKYSFNFGKATYINNAILNSKISIFDDDNIVRANIIKSNLYLLERLKQTLIRFNRTKKFEEFDEICYKGFGLKVQKIYNDFLKAL